MYYVELLVFPQLDIASNFRDNSIFYVMLLGKHFIYFACKCLLMYLSCFEIVKTFHIKNNHQFSCFDLAT